ncbi:MAG: SUMF1/EgtB/PvdO family nonheme iron enzyme [Trichodesmium sp. St18_bin1]|nr:SUMF1/EgtB/PvdO family nonheme iron enzyme [Trichodesmium sp. St18_bin1]MDE5118807.1 SUMF1/EgtB/PvdO family nonheme iron enzyme [Trichodesmium sp. St19_bin1]
MSSNLRALKIMRCLNCHTDGIPINLEMVYIPGGSFLMGSPKNEAERKSDEGPQHKVNLQPFLMSRYPITQDQYQAIMGPTDGSSWESGGNSNVRVLRGGCWFNNSGLCRSAGRNCYNAENLNFNWGFRFISSSPEVSGFCS